MSGRRRPCHPFRPLLEALEDRTLLSVYTVDRLTDTGDGSGLTGDLRYCIIQATDGDTIEFGVQGVINLNSSLPDLIHSISIEGPGQDALTVQPGNRGGFRTLILDGGATVTITGLTVATALDISRYDGSGILNAGTLTVKNVRFANNYSFAGPGKGGAIFNAGILIVSDCAFSGNEAVSGGDIYNDGMLTVLNSDFSGPKYRTTYGGIYNNISGAVEISACTFSIGSEGHDGAIFNAGKMTVWSSVFSRNEAYFGNAGAIYNDTAGILTVSDCTFSGNSSDNWGGALYNGGTLTVADSTFSKNGTVDGQGGAIYSDRGTLTVSDCNFLGNGTYEWGGAIYASSLVLVNSTISGSLTEYVGGAIDVGTGTISNCMINGNKCWSGAIRTWGQLTIENSTISGNESRDPGSGGGISNSGNLTVLNSTISGNSGQTSAIWNTGTLRVENSTISGNQSPGLPILLAPPGAITNIATYSGSATAVLSSCTIANNTVNNQTANQLYTLGTIVVRNTLISGRGNGPNLVANMAGQIVSQGHNLSSDDGGGFLTGPGDLTSKDPLLGPLQDNGGPTETMALLPGSPAIDAGAPTDSEWDQRGPGFPRQVNGSTDIGAYQTQSATRMCSAIAWVFCREFCSQSH
jgi:predicted outer membrane repeat protein